MWFTTNGMCVTNKTIIYEARASNSKRDCDVVALPILTCDRLNWMTSIREERLRAWSLLLLAVRGRSFMHRFMRRSTSLIHTLLKTKICMIYLHMMLSLKIKIKDIHHCKETDHVMLLSEQSEQATGNAHGPYRRPGFHGHHLGDPWFRLSTLGY